MLGLDDRKINRRFILPEMGPDLEPTSPVTFYLAALASITSNSSSFADLVIDSARLVGSTPKDSSARQLQEAGKIRFRQEIGKEITRDDELALVAGYELLEQR